jgi:hypothetical protein
MSTQLHRALPIVPDHAVLDIILSAIAEQVLHKDLRPQVRKRESAPFDVSLNKLMPDIVCHAGVIIPAGAKMNNVLHASLFGLFGILVLYDYT